MASFKNRRRDGMGMVAISAKTIAMERRQSAGDATDETKSADPPSQANHCEPLIGAACGTCTRQCQRRVTYAAPAAESVRRIAQLEMQSSVDIGRMRLTSDNLVWFHSCSRQPSRFNKTY